MDHGERQSRLGPECRDQSGTRRRVEITQEADAPRDAYCSQYHCFCCRPSNELQSSTAPQGARAKSLWGPFLSTSSPSPPKGASVLLVAMILAALEGALCISKLYYGALFGIGFGAYYFFEVVKAPSLFCAEGPFRDFLDDKVPILKSKFWPTLWCFESRAQTVFASLLRSRLWAYIQYRREILTLTDGGEVALDWAEHNCCPTSPIVIILPGLTGASQAEYIKCLVYAAENVSIKCVIFNNRGLGGVKLKTPRLYCASNCEDLAEVIEHVRGLHPNVPIAATGISMGGLILGNYLAQYGRAAIEKLKAGFAISVPWNVFEATKSIEKPYLNLMLNRHLCSNLRRNVKHHFSEEKERLNLDLDTVLKVHLKKKPKKILWHVPGFSTYPYSCRLLIGRNTTGC